MKKLSRSFKVSFAVGIIFTTLGLALSLSGFSNYGLALFFFLPLAIGVSSGLLPDTNEVIMGTISSLVLFSFIVIFTKVEGIVCLLMAMPILLLAIWLGWLIGKAIRRFKNKDRPSMKISFAPFLIFLVLNFFEVFSGDKMMYSSVTTSITLDALADKVYDAIIEVDTVDVPLNFLQKIGLPIPRKCSLTEEKVGGLRICEFEEGVIIETITEIRKNEYLRMDVTECKLGKERDWLRFDEDIYEINQLASGNTEISRTTTYYSNLKPRLYWEYMELLTIKSEQDFVFINLKKDVE